jgi:predicted dehydrogenase
VRVRRFFLAGTAGSATFDATSADAALTLADLGEDSRIAAKDGEAKELFYRHGELQIPALSPIQPLANECAQFLASVRTGHPPAADGRAGLAVVRVLEAATQSLARGGAPVHVRPAAAVPASR